MALAAPVAVAAADNLVAALPAVTVPIAVAIATAAAVAVLMAIALLCLFSNEHILCQLLCCEGDDLHSITAVTPHTCDTAGNARLADCCAGVQAVPGCGPSIDCPMCQAPAAAQQLHTGSVGLHGVCARGNMAFKARTAAADASCS